MSWGRHCVTPHTTSLAGQTPVRPSVRPPSVRPPSVRRPSVRPSVRRPSVRPSVYLNGWVCVTLQPPKPRQIVSVSWNVDACTTGAPLGSNDTFVDLGGGHGRVALQVVLTTSAGALSIELSSTRHGAAEVAAANLRKSMPEAGARLNLVHGNIENATIWSQGTF